MPVKQGGLELLAHPAAKQLLESQIPARLAYIWTDGSPRVIPIWFHWNGKEFILGTPPKAPKLKALAKNPKVALTIDDDAFPHKVLLVRGTAHLQTVDGVVAEYALPPSATSGAIKAKAGSSSSVAWFPIWFALRSRPSGSASSTSRPASPAPSPNPQPSDSAKSQQPQAEKYAFDNQHFQARALSILMTFAACGPLGPCTISKSTVSPSFKAL